MTSDMPQRPAEPTVRAAHGIATRSYVGRTWNGIGVYCVSTHTEPGKSWQSLASEQASVAVILEQQGGIAEPRKRLNTPTRRVRYDAGHTMYIPPNCDIWAFGDSTSLVRGVRMRFDLSVIESLLQGECDRQKWNEPVLLLYDDRIREIANLIWQECQAQDERPQLYGESLTAALLSCLFQSSRIQKRVSQQGLARIQLKRTVEYMEASLLRDVRLKELASVAGLSPSHFGRAFKASTGVTPHRWIIQRRIQLAQRLMRESGKSIVIASQMAGFANQSHFTKAFRAITGATPRVWLHDLVAGGASEDRPHRID
jgi:AraC family transcriptional regulator